jgi:hypothetical protein
MNKMHTIAKIAVGLLGVYLIISSVSYVLGMMATFLVCLFQAEWSTSIPIAVALIVSLCFIWFVFYYLICHSDKFAQRVVGQGDELPDPPSPSVWYPFALRLAVVITGVLFLQKAISLSSSLVHYIRFAFQSNTLEGMRQVYEYAVYFLIYLAISIYLLTGAPHFVRWQVKKTLELCKEFSEK